jgi:hypothetical protein
MPVRIILALAILTSTSHAATLAYQLQSGSQLTPVGGTTIPVTGSFTISGPINNYFSIQTLDIHPTDPTNQSYNLYSSQYSTDQIYAAQPVNGGGGFGGGIPTPVAGFDATVFASNIPGSSLGGSGTYLGASTAPSSFSYPDLELYPLNSGGTFSSRLADLQLVADLAVPEPPTIWLMAIACLWPIARRLRLGSNHRRIIRP